MVTVGASASVLGLGSAAAPEACVRLDVAGGRSSGGQPGGHMRRVSAVGCRRACLEAVWTGETNWLMSA